ncbi:MAG: MAPEG family protein [Hyphomicrobium sp.]
MAVTALYAALLAALYIYLSVRVIGQRREAHVEIGAGDSAELLRRMRVHANFAEYAPFALLLMALAESLKAPSIWLHLLGIGLVTGRIIHAWGLSKTPHVLRLRVLGMGLTFTVIGAAALTCFVLAGIQLIV